MYTVEVRAGVLTGSTRIHSFLHITNPDGTTESWGFHPADSGLSGLNGAGQVKDDTGADFTSSSGPMSLSQDQYDSLKDYIDDSIANPPPYSLPFGSHCTTWAVEGLAEADVIPDFLSPGMAPDNLWTDLVQTVIWNPLWQSIGFQINDLWNQFKNWTPPRRDPLAIDLDGDGIETIGADGTVVFDHDGDGVKTGTGWVSADDGLLVLDRDGNGTIDTGAELFGVDTVKADGSNAVDGFDALSELDSNGDGIFDVQDTEFANVQIWQDADQDGISDAGELSSLTELGIVSIDLNAETNNVNLGNGNVQTATSAHLTVDGEEGTTGNLDLASNSFYSEFTNAIPLTEAALALPNSSGSGMVRDLREAMSLSSGLTSIVSTYTEQISYSDQHAQLDDLVTAWAETSTMQTSIELALDNDFNLIYMIPGQSVSDFNGTGGVGGGGGSGNGGSTTIIDEEALAEQQALMAQQENIIRIIAVLEKFNGDQFVTVDTDSVTTGAGATITASAEGGGGGGVVTNPDAPRRAFVMISAAQIELLTQSYEQLKESVYGNLVMQTRLSDYTDEISLDISETGEISLDFSAMNALLETRRTENPANALADLIELARYSGPSFYSNSWDGLNLLRAWISEGVGDNAIETVLSDLNVLNTNENTTATNGDEIILDGSNDSSLSGLGGNDIILGGDGNDYIYGQNGNDILEGGNGRDYLFGGNDNDILRGGAGDGDYLSGDTGNDIYLFGLGDGNTTISNYDTGANSQDSLRFLNGINPGDVKASRSGQNLLLTVQSTGEVITVQSYFYNDAEDVYALDQIGFSDGTIWNVGIIKTLVQQGSSSDDALHGYAVDDNLDGQEGNDTIYGADGNDNLDGGDGRDVVYGGAGDDTLRGGTGDNDTLSGDAGNDTYLFGLGDGNTTISNYDAGADRQDTLQFLEGINADDVRVTRSSTSLVLTVQSTGEAVTISSFFSGSIYELNQVEFSDGTTWSADDLKAFALEATDGADNITGYASDDTINSLGGNDYLYGAGGNDNLDGGDGNDWVFGQNDDDTVNGGAGNDYVYGDAGNDTLNGGDGRDVVYGGAGDDTLRGGTGDNDTLSGDAGNDTYLFGLGDGNTTISNYDAGADRQDTLQFLEGINADDVRVTRSSTSLVLTVQSTGEAVTISSFFSGSIYELNQVEFSDGTTWSADDLKAFALEATDGADNITGYASDDTINSLGGNDYLYGAGGNDNLDGGDGNDWVFGQNDDDTVNGGAGNDYVYGDAGNDTLNGGDGRDVVYGGAGDDTLRGGTGANDTLSGDAGNDTYLFGSGDGNTTISNYDAGANRQDTLRFLEGISTDDVRATRSSTSLVLTLQSTGETITVSSFFSGSVYELNQVEFADGTVWDADTLKSLVQEGSAGADNLYGYADADILDGQEGNDYVYGGAGNDNLQGGDGNDWIFGQNDDDTVNGGAGNDYVYGDAGNDTLDGGEGRDVMHGGTGDDTLLGSAGNNDTLSGDAGNDTYVFDADFGTDTVSNYDPDANSVDIAQFDNVSIEDLWFSRNGNNLQITVAGTDNQVTVSSWYSGNVYQLDSIQAGTSTLLNNQVDQLVNAMAAYNVPLGAGNVVPQDIQDELQTTLAETWQS